VAQQSTSVCMLHLRWVASGRLAQLHGGAVGGCHVQVFTWFSIARKENNTTINLGEAVVKWHQRLSDAMLKILNTTQVLNWLCCVAS